MHLSDTPFTIQQPIQRPRLLERVYKPIHTLHWCRVFPLRAQEIGCKWVERKVCPCAVTTALIKDYYIQYFRLYLSLIYHYTLSVPSYDNMEVLTSTNRMSATTFLSLYFLVNMAPDCIFNVTGLV